MFDPASFGYPVKPNIDKGRLSRLLNHFEGEVKREQDKRLASDLRRDLVESSSPAISKDAFLRLARWCKTDGIYGDAMDVAKKISEEIFGRVIDRSKLGT